MKHDELYRLLNILINKLFSFHLCYGKKKIIKSSLICKGLYGRTIQRNTKGYKEFIISLNDITSREISLYLIGPFSNMVNENKIKVYLLIITSMWSRVVNLLI